MVKKSSPPAAKDEAPEVALACCACFSFGSEMVWLQAATASKCDASPNLALRVVSRFVGVPRVLPDQCFLSVCPPFAKKYPRGGKCLFNIRYGRSWERAAFSI